MLSISVHGENFILNVLFKVPPKFMYFYLSEKNVNQNDTFQPLVMGSFEAYNALEKASSNNKNNNNMCMMWWWWSLNRWLEVESYTHRFVEWLLNFILISVNLELSTLLEVFSNMNSRVEIMATSSLGLMLALLYIIGSIFMVPAYAQINQTVSLVVNASDTGRQMPANLFGLFFEVREKPMIIMSLLLICIFFVFACFFEIFLKIMSCSNCPKS